MTAGRHVTPKGTESHLSLAAPGPAPDTRALRITATLADGTRLELEVQAADWGITTLGEPVAAPAIYVTPKNGKRARGKLAPLLAAAALTADDPVSA